VKVFRSADGRWRIEQAPTEIRVYSRTGPAGGWTPRTTCRTVSEVAAWLAAQGDPVDEWVED
jgi:hypothetical protein